MVAVLVALATDPGLATTNRAALLPYVQARVFVTNTATLASTIAF